MSHFPDSGIVTVVNPKDPMSGHQGEVSRSFCNDEGDCEILVVVKFHVRVVGPRSDLVRRGDYYVGVKHSRGFGVFAYQDRSPEPSSIRLVEGYTEENKMKMGIPLEVAA